MANCPPLQPLSVLATLALTPDSWGLWGLPLPMLSTSGRAGYKPSEALAALLVAHSAGEVEYPRKFGLTTS
jgi:hypothetical protein